MIGGCGEIAMNKLVALAVGAALAVGTISVAPQPVEARDRTGQALVAGMVGLAAGAIIGSALAGGSDDGQVYAYDGYDGGYRPVQYYYGPSEGAPGFYYPPGGPRGRAIRPPVSNGGDDTVVVVPDYRRGYVRPAPQYGYDTGDQYGYGYQRPRYQPRVVPQPYVYAPQPRYERQRNCYNVWDYDDNGRRVLKRQCSSY
jgi:hypothetical protein